MDNAAATATTGEHCVGRIEDFPPGSHRVVDVDRREIGVFNIGGTFHALPNVCPHQTGPVCRAKRLGGALVVEARGSTRVTWAHEGEVIACPWHGLEYHVPTGQCLNFKQIRLRQYPVTVRDGGVFVRVGRPRPGA